MPAPLPPDPPLRIDASMQALLDEANQALGRLDGVTLLLPDPGQFLYAYIRKEAVLSSQIEGTQSSLSDLLLFENEAVPGVPLHDSATACSVRSTRCSCRACAEATRRRVSSGAPRTGSAERARATRVSCRRLPQRSSRP